MKFIPVPSRSPRLLRRTVLDTDPPVTLELVHDPVGRRTICRLVSAAGRCGGSG
jgi:hypothetical protein